MKRNILIIFLTCFLLSTHSFAFTKAFLGHPKQSDKLIKPEKLKVGDTVALVASASRLGMRQQITFAKERLEALGLTVILGNSVFQQEGYFAGTDQARAMDINAMFANPKVKAIFEVRGGWGCARILPYLDYALIQKNPKIIIGFSDITALLLAIEERSHLVTFYGPLAALPWPEFTVEYLKKVLFDGVTPLVLKNPTNEIDLKKDIIQSENRIETLVPGKAKGILLGGNLSIIISLLGTPYEPDWTGKVLFLEDVDETHYRIDRMMAQLQQAGVLKKISGLIFGTCKNCHVDMDTANSTDASFSIAAILSHYLKPYHIPAFMGSMIGHDPMIFTLPEGVKVEMNANKGTIQILEASVKKV